VIPEQIRKYELFPELQFYDLYDNFRKKNKKKIIKPV